LTKYNTGVSYKDKQKALQNKKPMEDLIWLNAPVAVQATLPNAPHVEHVWNVIGNIAVVIISMKTGNLKIQKNKE